MDISEYLSVPLVRVNGEVDIHTASNLREVLFSVADDRSRELILDLSESRYIDSTGLGVIAHAAKKVQDNGGEHFYIVSSRTQVRKIFKMSGLEKKNVILVNNLSEIKTSVV